MQRFLTFLGFKILSLKLMLFQGVLIKSHPSTKTIRDHPSKVKGQMIQERKANIKT
jgi:hypothetical protein